MFSLHCEMHPESKTKSRLRNQPSFDLIQEENDPQSSRSGFHLLDALEEGFFSDFSIVTNDGCQVMSLFFITVQSIQYSY